jgi:hypothetical protein
MVAAEEGDDDADDIAIIEYVAHIYALSLVMIIKIIIIIQVHVCNLTN